MIGGSAKQDHGVEKEWHCFSKKRGEGGTVIMILH